MINGLVVSFFLGGWIVYSLAFFGINQVWNLTFGLLAFLCSLKNIIRPEENKNYQFSIKLIFLFSVSFFVIAATDFLIQGSFPSLGKSLMFLFLPVFYFLIMGINSVGLVAFQRAGVFLLVATNFVALTFLSQFSEAHFKFLPAVSWAYVTSNNISYFSTIVGALLLLVDYYRFGYIRKWMGFVVAILTLVHFSKSHFLSLVIAFSIAFILRMSVLAKFFIFIIFVFVLWGGVAIGVNGLESLVMDLNIKPLTKIYYGSIEFPALINIYGFFDALFIFVEDVGDPARAIVYRNALSNISLVGMIGAPDYVIQNVFSGKDYHNTFFYAAYEFGFLGLLVVAAIIMIVGKEVFSAKGKYFFFSVVVYLYFIFRVLFISLDIYWMVVYWAVYIRILGMCSDGKKEN